ncbi:RNA-directed DNA polymerase, eukaryota [Artemisia annua]|uniref:RNA-directed DNA polymerase, eukaryota n=1 Tax=Artemisia annua TaxID=35608 RepID=A0A2U1KU45_ARTAN|nr:RNA-directed DNA polymerase, eukaryota [Artemisia annua]
MDFSNLNAFEWCSWIPNKCNIFGWRAEMGRIPTASALRKRNIQIADSLCVLCESAEENVDHLFSGCIFASRLWQHISTWCKVPNIFVFSFKDLLDLHNFVGLSGKKKEIFYGLMIIVCWCIWRARNSFKFQNKKARMEGIIGEVKVLGFLWAKSRAKLHNSLDQFKTFTIAESEHPVSE